MKIWLNKYILNHLYLNILLVRKTEKILHEKEILLWTTLTTLFFDYPVHYDTSLFLLPSTVYIMLPLFFLLPSTVHIMLPLFFLLPLYSVHYDTSLFFTPLSSSHYVTSLFFYSPCTVYIMIPLFFYSPVQCTLWCLSFFYSPVQCTLWYLSFFTSLYSVHYDTSLWSNLFKDAQRRPARELVNPDQASSTFSTLGRNLGNQSIKQLIKKINQSRNK